MPAYEAYGQTDINNDPARLLAAAHGQRGREAVMRMLEQRERQQQQQQQFRERMSDKQEAREEGMANRRTYQDQINEARQGRIANTQQAQEAARMEHLRSFITNPPPGTNPESLRSATQQYYQAMHIPMGLTPQQTAENEVRKAHGQPLIQPPQTGGQSGVAAGGGTTAVAAGAPGGGEQQLGGVGSSLERGVQAAVGGEPTSAPYYNPAVGANMVRTASGREVPVGAPDPSVGATETAVRTPLVGGGEQLNFPSGGIARSGVAGETRAAKALREPMFAPSQMAAGGATSTTPGAQPQTQTAAATPGGGVGAPTSTPKSGTPPESELQPYGQPTQFHAGIFAGVPRALGIPQIISAYSQSQQPQQPQQPQQSPQQPTQFAPANLAQPPGAGPFGHPVPPVGAAAPASPAQQPPPIAGQPGAGFLPIRSQPQLPPPQML